MIDRERIQSAFSSSYRLFIRHQRRNGEFTAIDLLKHELPNIDPSSWEERLAFGGVFINGIGYYEDTPLPEICKVEYYEPRFDYHNASSQYPAFSCDWIVWEDTDLIVTFKPARLPSMPGKEQRYYNLKTYLESHLGITLHFPSRLDMSTQGLIIASKTERMHGAIQSLFERRTIEKRYLFQTASTPQFNSLIVDAPIGKSEEHPVLRAPHGAGAKSAITDLQVIHQEPFDISSDAQSSFIRAIPRTGRTHQIRVHAAHAGVPIIGDNFYGGAHASPLRLLSYALNFTHPFTDERIKLIVPCSLTPPWAIPVTEYLSSDT